MYIFLFRISQPSSLVLKDIASHMFVKHPAAPWGCEFATYGRLSRNRRENKEAESRYVADHPCELLLNKRQVFGAGNKQSARSQRETRN